MGEMILVCRCGKRIRAPGAVPGRVGHCPSCGATLRVPEDSPRPKPAPATAATIAVEAAPTTAAVVRPKSKRRRKKARGLIDRLEGWEGLVRRPETPASARSVARNLLYPLWDANGLAFLVVFPILWWLISLPTFEYLSLLAQGEAASAVPIRALIPSLMGLIIVLGYTLAFLNQVLFSSAMGETRHPRWPDLDLWELIRGVMRWAWALLAGFLVGGLPAVWFWSRTEEPRFLDWAIFGGLWALGALYAQVALVASLLFDDVLAVNPVTVGRAVWVSRFGFLRSLIVSTVILVLVGGLLAAVLHISEPHLAVGSWLLFWGVSFYGALVAMRVLGAEYHRHARALGWFRQGRFSSGR